MADRGNHRIQVFDANGTFLRKFGSSGSLEGQFRYPLSLDFSDEGNLMVGDHDNRRIVHFTKSGNFYGITAPSITPLSFTTYPTDSLDYPTAIGLKFTTKTDTRLNSGTKAAVLMPGFPPYPTGPSLGWTTTWTRSSSTAQPTRTIRPPNSRKSPTLKSSAWYNPTTRTTWKSLTELMTPTVPK